jgi:hypothetical protein
MVTSRDDDIAAPFITPILKITEPVITASTVAGGDTLRRRKVNIGSTSIERRSKVPETRLWNIK